jgi:4-carboxymuconolactone decarboxylase
MAAIPAIEKVFTNRNVETSDLTEANPGLLPLNETAEQARAHGVEADYGQVAPGVVEKTTEILFRDLWLRPDLEPRDRSLITVVALVSTGQVQQIPFHLNRAMDNGLTSAETGETLTQLAFYAGWPKVFTAMPIVKQTLASRPE